MKQISPFVRVIGMSLLLAACQSNTETAFATAPTDDQGANATVAANRYQTLASQSPSNSILGGVAARSKRIGNDGNLGSRRLVTISGALAHDTGATVLSDGTYTLIDANGMDADGIISDGISTLQRETANTPYEYVSLYYQGYDADGATFDSIGVMGIVTSAADIPKSGSATYTGQAEAIIDTASQKIDLVNGRSTVAANFASGTVNVTMDGFTARNPITGATVIAPIDTVTATGMKITGNRFDAGSIATTKDGSTVNLTGANTTATAQGMFFGYDTARIVPDETAGIFLVQGAQGDVFGSFIAD